MAVLIGDHHLKSFDEWFEVFKSNPPPPQGTWRLLQSRDDPNRVFVIAEVDDNDVAAVEQWAASDRMQDVFTQVNAMSTRDLEMVWTDDKTPH
jgi:hypothetical protein